MSGSNGNPAEKSCKTCAFCKQIYGLFGYCARPLERFFCNVAENMTESTNCCGRWEMREEEKPDLSFERFQKAEEDIKAIKAILKRYDRSLMRKARH